MASRKRAAFAERPEVCAEGLLKPLEAARFLGISRSSLYQLIAEGSLPFCEIGARGGDRRLPKLALISFAESKLRLIATAPEDAAA